MHIKIHVYRLTRLPDEICEMQNLEFLNAGMNPLHDLPPNFAKLAKLRIAFFLGCEFTTVQLLN